MYKRKNRRLGRLERSSVYSPKRLLFTVAFSIFICESFVMIIFSLFHFSHWFHSFLDAFLLIILVSPALYLFLFRPMVHHTKELKEAEEALQRAHNGLERRVEERTKDLEKANEQLRLQMNKIKEDERKIQESEVHFQAVAHSAKEAIITTDSNGRITFWNRAAQEMFDYTEDSMLGQKVTFLMPEKYRKAHDDGIERYLSTGESNIIGKTTEYYGLRKEGAEFPLELSLATWKAEEEIFFTAIIRDITKRKEVEAKIRRNHDIESVTYSLLRLSLEDIPIEEILERALELILSISWLSFEARACIFLVEDEQGFLVMKAQNKLDEAIQKECERLPLGRCLCGRAVLKKEIEFADCVDDRHEIRYEGIRPHGHYCVPILYAGKVLGVINLYVKEGHKRDMSEEDFLTSIANTLAGIIQRKHLDEERQDTLVKLRRAMGGSIQLLADTSEVRDPYTAGHQRGVANLAQAIATEMGLTRDQIDGIRMAGAIHDLGKLSVPSDILSKPAKLNDMEFNLIKIHPQVGYEILSKVEFPWPLAEIILQHHERMNGSGYPQGLSGEEILLEARILAVADVIEAMASHRPYRPALGIDKALEEIQENKGTLYDPDVVDACLKILKERKFELNMS